MRQRGFRAPKSEHEEASQHCSKRASARSQHLGSQHSAKRASAKIATPWKPALFQARQRQDLAQHLESQHCSKRASAKI
jgi:hypothetical protein